MKLYTADCRGDAKNTSYPHCVEIKTKRDFIQAMNRDHMTAAMTNNYRDSSNFEGCDCIMFDIDNTHTDDPEGWITADDIAETFPVNYMLVRSRNYMKEKRKVDKKTGAVKISEPREKWHVYAPLAHPITRADDFAQLIKNILCLFPFLDPAAIDTARFFFGVENPHVTFETGGQCIDEYLDSADPIELRHDKEAAILNFAEKIKSGDYKDEKQTRLVVTIGCEFLEIKNPLPSSAPEQYDLNNLELGDNLDWIDAADQRRALQWLENWAQQWSVTLGRRYTIPSGVHAGAVAICVTCPWEHEHSGGNWPDNEAVILVERSGKLDFVCRHSHGAALHWSDYRKACERPDLDGAAEALREGSATQQKPAEENTRPDSVLTYINTRMDEDITKFAQEIKTGFAEFDREAGGLYPGLYTIGAVSSLGKTSFCLQLADQIAAGGHDVLFFSMEQTRLELVSKSIVRTIAKKDITTTLTSLKLRRGYLPQPALDAAREYCESVGDRLSIIEGIFNCDINYISNYIRDYIKLNDRRPVVFIDYLQILQPTEDAQRRPNDTKATIDAAVRELKIMSHELRIPVIVISSLNRANYLLPIDFESFKESGLIEYSSDVIFGLQFRCLHDPEFEKIKTITEKRDRISREKNSTPRKLELVALKNRYGRPSFCCGFDYFPSVDLFREVTTDFTPADELATEGEEATPWGTDYLNMRR